MSTQRKSAPAKIQTRVRTMADGLISRTYAPLSSLVVVGSALSKAEIIAKLKGWIALGTAVVQAKQAYSSATAARKTAETAMLVFYASVVGLNGASLIVAPCC